MGKQGGGEHIPGHNVGLGHPGVPGCCAQLQGADVLLLAHLSSLFTSGAWGAELDASAAALT